MSNSFMLACIFVGLAAGLVLGTVRIGFDVTLILGWVYFFSSFFLGFFPL